MSDIDSLLAAKTAADEALADAETNLVNELVTAKDAHRNDPTPENAERKAAAVQAIQQYRAVTREGRTTNTVGGDAYAMPSPNGEG